MTTATTVSVIKSMLKSSFSLLFVTVCIDTAMLAIPGVVHGNPLAITPSATSLISSGRIWSRPREEHALRVEGGLPPYRWQCLSGDITPVPGSTSDETPAAYIYKAPSRYGVDRIAFIDGAGQKAELEVTLFRPLKVTPSELILPTGGTETARIVGGSGEWNETAPAGLITGTGADPAGNAGSGIVTCRRNESKGLLEITAGKTPGKEKILIKDKITRDEAILNIQIFGPLKLIPSGVEANDEKTERR